MASFSFLCLPIDLQIHVLACSPDFLTLLTATLAHPSLKRLYLLSPETIIQGILSPDDPQIRRLVVATFHARHRKVAYRHKAVQILQDLEGLLDWRSTQNSEIKFVSNFVYPCQALQFLVHYTEETEKLAQVWTRFAIYHSSHLCPTPTTIVDSSEEAKPLSSTERIRIRRSLWRLQLYAELFPFSENPETVNSIIDAYDLLDHRSARLRFVELLRPSELAEIRSADVFLSNRCRHLSQVASEYYFGHETRGCIPWIQTRIPWPELWDRNCLMARLGYHSKMCTIAYDLRRSVNWSTPLANDLVEAQGSDGPNGTWTRIQESGIKTNETMYRFWEALGLFLWDEERLKRYRLTSVEQFTPKDGLDRIAVTLAKEGHEFKRSCWAYLWMKRNKWGQNGLII